MCLNCGCGEPDKRHQPTDITQDDLQRRGRLGDHPSAGRAKRLDIESRARRLRGGRRAAEGRSMGRERSIVTD